MATRPRDDEPEAELPPELVPQPSPPVVKINPKENIITDTDIGGTQMFISIFCIHHHFVTFISSLILHSLSYTL